MKKGSECGLILRDYADLQSGDTIPLKNASAFPTTERVLASKDEQAVYDQRPDPNKYMYKSFSSEKIFDRDYEAWVTRASSNKNEADTALHGHSPQSP